MFLLFWWWGELKPLFVYGYLRKGLPLALSIACHTRYQKSDRGIPPSSLYSYRCHIEQKHKTMPKRGRYLINFIK
ncbi:MAG: hypothetical protein Q4A56_08625 [Porphyromonadaceae bacterium]|nr:hypothetical protein [Porphyromonadaceae bacterium]